MSIQSVPCAGTHSGVNFFSFEIDTFRFDIPDILRLHGENIILGKYGELTDNINMFARALGDYVRLKYQEFTHTEGPNHEFTQYNHYHIKDFYKTHNDGKELLRFKNKFDSLIVDLKANNIIIIRPRSTYLCFPHSSILQNYSCTASCTLVIKSP